jgi:hypothetical protein
MRPKSQPSLAHGSGRKLLRFAHDCRNELWWTSLAARFFSPEWRFLTTCPALSIETKFALSRCSFSDQTPKFFISFDEVDQFGV